MARLTDAIENSYILSYIINSSSIFNWFKVEGFFKDCVCPLT